MKDWLALLRRSIRTARRRSDIVIPRTMMRKGKPDKFDSRPPKPLKHFRVRTT